MNDIVVFVYVLKCILLYSKTYFCLARWQQEIGLNLSVSCWWSVMVLLGVVVGCDVVW